MNSNEMEADFLFQQIVYGWDPEFDIDRDEWKQDLSQ